MLNQLFLHHRRYKTKCYLFIIVDKIKKLKYTLIMKMWGVIMDTVKDYEAKIRMLYSELRKSEKKVADYILLNKEKIGEMGLEEIARNSDVSTPTVIRFTKALGYEGLKEFKIALLKSSKLLNYNENSGLLLDLHVNKEDKLEN